LNLDSSRVVEYAVYLEEIHFEKYIKYILRVVGYAAYMELPGLLRRLLASRSTAQ
jgi:hypothetical protein